MYYLTISVSQGSGHGQLGLLLWDLQGCDQVGLHSHLEAELGKNCFRGAQVVGRIHLLVAVGLRTPASCWRLPQRLETTHSSLPRKLFTSGSQQGQSAARSL